MSESIAVVGLGSYVRRDDRIGLEVLGRLRTRPRAGIAYFEYGTMSLDLIQRLGDYSTALLIDAIRCTGASPGDLFIRALESLDYSSAAPITSSHGFDLKTFFDLSKNLGIATRIYLAGVQVEDVSFGEELSVSLKARLPAITREIENFINRLEGHL